MSKRLNQDREKELQPKRVATTKKKLVDMGFLVEQKDHTCLQFEWEGNTISFWPYSGWFSGKGLGDGRGFDNMLTRMGKGKQVTDQTRKKKFHTEYARDRFVSILSEGRVKKKYEYENEDGFTTYAVEYYRDTKRMREKHGFGEQELKLKNN